ncbi:MAG: pyridoxamine 5'-phosphate oxidase family protein [Desulfobacterales bacterium]|nr:pyridoxamine 5'-phosphate oxidase family protein [Desulfobacterales bacterium]
MPIDEKDMDPVRRDCLAMIAETRVITVSTGRTAPWAAPVYYLYDGGSFYFFSNPEARHIREGAGLPCAASVFRDASDTSQLQGLQMSGGIEKCPLDAGTAKLALAYAGHYGIKPTANKVLDYFKHRFHARMYRFTPDTAYYMDNRRGIGSRTEIDL